MALWAFRRNAALVEPSVPPSIAFTAPRQPAPHSDIAHVGASLALTLPPTVASRVRSYNFASPTAARRGADPRHRGLSGYDLARHYGTVRAMTEDACDDWHPSDAEFERLLALHADARRAYTAALGAPVDETYAQRADREQRVRIACAEMDRIERALNDLSFADPDAQPITRVPYEPHLPLLPGPPSWRTSLTSFYGAGVEQVDRVESDAIIASAVDEARAALTANPRAEPPRLLAMQVYDHHVARGERLSDHALELLARAMRIDQRSVVAAQRRARIAAAGEAGLGTKEIAAELGVDPRTVRLLRNSQTPEDAALYTAVAEGKDLRALRPAVAAALDLLAKDGRWRTDVLAAIHAGTRNADLIWKAARVEAGRRKAGKEPNNAKLIASTMWIAHAMRIDPRWVERWIARPDWEMAVTVEAVWLRGWPGTGLLRMAARVEAQRRLDGHPVNLADQIAAALETPCPVHPSKVKQMIAPPGWERAVDAEVAEAVWLRGQQGAGRNPDADRD